MARQPLVARLRDAGAIILAKAVCTEYNAAGLIGDAGGRHRPSAELPSTLGYQRRCFLDAGPALA